VFSTPDIRAFLSNVVLAGFCSAVIVGNKATACGFAGSDGNLVRSKAMALKIAQNSE
jgi:hypothetical protein